MHRSYLYPHNPTFGALSSERAHFFTFEGIFPPHPDKNKTEVALGFGVQRRLREPFLRSVAWRTSA